MRRVDRIKLLLLMALFAAPALAAWVAHSVFPPQGGKSHGQLLEPRVPDLAGLVDGHGQPADHLGRPGNWVLVTVAGDGCGEDCRRLVRLTRQVRLAQGREQHRVVQAVVTGGGMAPPDEGGLLRYRLPEDTLRRLHDGKDPAVYVLDPLGQVMLRFPAQPDGKGMIRDLRTLLAASRLG